MGVMYGVVVVTVVMVVSVAAAVPPEEDNIVATNRTARYGIIKALLPYINLRIKNPFECSSGKSINGYKVIGTCMSIQDCYTNKGRVDGECASGYGSCCILEAECGSTISLNRTYIINNGSYTSGGFSCQYNIQRPTYLFKRDPSDKDIQNQLDLLGSCQVRLDFEALSLGQPEQALTTGGTSTTVSMCNGDYFEVTNSINSFGRICGENQGQHIYLPVSPNSTNVATINIVGSATSAQGATTPASRQWRIKVNYIPCLSNRTAPPGCLQYHTAASGIINSFNYQAPSSTPTKTYQIGNLRYGICIGDMDGMCGIQFDATTFSISGAAPAAGATGTSTTGATTCITDYVSLLVIDKTGVPKDAVYCGTLLPSLITYARPFIIQVRTDSSEQSDTFNAGFSIPYKRLACA